MPHVELLAPAGNYDAFLGAINAGADAVYLAGNRFGARAYAENFSEEEICRAIRLAHFYGKKIYLTVNTLVKENELDGLVDYLAPFCAAGLDAVIVQDFGVLRFLHRHFPKLALHASTQMTLTGVLGASLIKEEGVCRIVPARELSLAEIRELKEKTQLELECFIHGAMCYCYSGQCLFSSILGGRSGNRGRCAQPCRLPYQIEYADGKKSAACYPLSLKDMCTLSILPKLIAAGIDSFKIEGRMKRPEYAAGVTALYRKYIDRFADNPEAYQVDSEDLEQLKNLYIRSEIQTGYYDRHNGREMITLQKPSYLGSEKGLLDRLREKYIHEPNQTPVSMYAVLRSGSRMELTIRGAQGEVSVSGEIVMPAQRAPLTDQELQKQLSKTGASLIYAAKVTIEMTGECFLPVKSINDLRRKAVRAYEDMVIQKMGFPVPEESAEYSSTDHNSGYAPKEVPKKHTAPTSLARDVLVSAMEQLRTALKHKPRRIYIESDLYLSATVQIRELIGIGTQQCFLALPHILRKRDETYLCRMTELLERDELIQGFLVRNLEATAYLSGLLGKASEKKIVTDAGLYGMNREALSFLGSYADEATLPYELNAGECRILSNAAKSQSLPLSLIAYSRIPMMITANCIRQTDGLCVLKDPSKRETPVYLSDRKQARFSVCTNCKHCYNIIYNSIPYSLHRKEKDIAKVAPAALRYDFVLETSEEMDAILTGKVFPFEEYTTGHFQRGVE